MSEVKSETTIVLPVDQVDQTAVGATDDAKFQSKKNLEKRYVVACQIIANMTKELDFESFSNTDMIDLSICKLLIDGYIEVEEEIRKIH